MSSLYSEIRGTIKTGDLVSWKAGKINSIFDFILYVYQKILKPKSVHVGIVINVGGRLMVVEARPPAVRIFPLSMMENFDYVKTNIEEKSSNLDFLLRDVGVPYELMDVLKGIILESKGKDELYCSEQCYNFYKEVGLLADDKYIHAGRLPETLVEAILKATGNTFQHVIIDREHLDAV
jgi:uncharacterized protein YycO